MFHSDRIPCKSTASVLLTLALTLILSVASAGAQTGNGTITGQVTDVSAAAVAGAAITSTNQETGVTAQATSNESGNYTFPSLPAGTYTIATVVKGFQTSRVTNVVLDAAGDRSLNFQMVVGQVSQEVVVSSVSQNEVETTNAQIASTITGNQVQDIALNGRNYTQLLRLLPGTVSVTLDPFAIQLNSMSQYVNGIRGASILNMADGIILEDISGNISVFAVPSADSISEVRVLQASYSAENPSPYGGATTNVVTKSGTHDFHGGAYEFIRNTAFNSKADYATVNLPLHFQDYGFTLGGPAFIPNVFNAQRKKLFFFVSEEWKIIHQSTNSTGVVPTALQRQGIFSTPVYQPGTKTLYPAGSCSQNPSVLNNAATGYCVPQSAISPTGLAMLNIYPQPTNTAAAAGTSNYATALPNKLDNREDRINFDYVAGSKDLISVRYAHEQNNQSGAGALNIIPVTLTPRPAWIWSANYTHNFSANLLNVLTIGMSHNKFTQIPDTRNVSLAKTGINVPNPFPANVLGVIPSLAITGYTGYTTGSADTKTPQNLLLSNDLTWVKGNHTIKAGLYMDKGKNDEHNLTSSTTQGSVTYNTSATTTSGNAVADALLGNFYQYSQSSIPGFFLFRYLLTEGYVQDNWKASRKLAVEYGLRYSYSELPVSAINNMSTFNPALYSAAQAPTVAAANGALSGTYNPYNGLEIVGNGFPSNASQFFSQSFLTNPAVLSLFKGIPRSFSNTPKTNFAPRIGIAYDVFGDGKTSIRAGYGIFFMRQNTFTYSTNTQNLPFNSNASLFNGTISNPAGTPGTVFPTTLYTFPQTFQTAYVQTRNFGIQHQLPGQLILDVNYVGNQALHLPIILNINQLPAGTVSSNNTANKGVNPNALRPYKGYADIEQQAYVDTSSYNSLQGTIGRRVTHGLNFSASMTWSKTMEGTSQNLQATTLPRDSYNYKADYSVADIHRSKVVTGNAVYELPFFAKSDHALLRAGVAGWTLSGVFSFQTGAPTNVSLSTDVAGTSSVAAGLIGGMTQRPNIVPGVDPYTHNNCSGLNKFPNCQYLNSAAFATPAPGTFGNASRNYVVGPSYTSTDTSVFKHFRFGEKRDFQFRAEAFNIFNRGNLTTLPATFGTGTFGQISTATPGRVLQFGGKFAF